MAVDIQERPTGQLVPLMADPDATAVSKLEQVVIHGNLAELTPQQRVVYYRTVCESLDLNPLTRPFDYIVLNTKLTLYANRSCTDQLRRSRGIQVDKLEREQANDLAIVIAYGSDRTGRTDSALGAVAILGLKGEALANALMKAETKAKRRLTLSLAGLGLLDEVETAAIPGAQRVDVDMVTGEIAERSEPADLADTIDAKLAELETPIAGETPTETPAVAQALGIADATDNAPAAAAEVMTASTGSGEEPAAEASGASPGASAAIDPTALCGSVSTWGDGETCTRKAGHPEKTCRGSDSSTWDRPTAAKG